MQLNLLQNVAPAPKATISLLPLNDEFASTYDSENDAPKPEMR